jgi:hypothetical protein
VWKRVILYKFIVKMGVTALLEYKTKILQILLKGKLTTVRPLTKLNATVISRLAAETTWNTAKCYKIFPIRFKYCSIKTIKSTYLCYKMCWKRCPCTRKHTLYRLNRLKFTRRSSSWVTSKISLLPNGGSFWKLRPSNYPINRSRMG